MDAIELISQLKADLRAAKDNKAMVQKFIWTISKALDASQGAFYMVHNIENKHMAKFEAGYAYFVPESQVVEFEFGEGLVGQVAQTGEIININEVPNGYIQVISGLGKATPSSLIVYPIKKSGEVIAVFEVASFKQFQEDELAIINKSAEILIEVMS